VVCLAVVLGGAVRSDMPAAIAATRGLLVATVTIERAAAEELFQTGLILRQQIAGIARSYWPGAVIYASATAVALLSPLASVVLFGAIAVFYMLPSARFARLPG